MLLAAASLALPAAAQPWESAPPKTFLRPLAKPAPLDEQKAPASKAPAPKASAPKAPAAKAPATKVPAVKAPAPKAAAPVAQPKAAAPAPRPAPAVPAPQYARPAASPAATPPATPRPPPAAPRPPASTPARPIGTPAAPAAGRAVMIIDSRGIADPRTGVRQLARISAQLTTEFAARAANLEQLKTRTDNAQADLTAAKGGTARTLTPKVKAQVDQYETESKAFEDAYNARSNALVVPVQLQVNEALQAFASARGATVVIDGSRFNDSVLMLQAGVNPSTLDQTQAFIDSYNAAHP